MPDRRTTKSWLDAKQVGIAINTRRKHLRMDLVTLSQHSSIAPNMLERLEAGQISEIREETLQRVAQALHTSVAYLTGSTVDPAPREEEVIEIICNPPLTDDEHAKVRQFIRSLRTQAEAGNA